MTEPVGYLNSGWSYLRVAEHTYYCCEVGSLKLSILDPVTTLVGHAIELELKSLIWHGSKCAAPFTHDLEALFRQARKYGLNMNLSSDDSDALRLLSGEVGVAPYASRYLKTGVAIRIPYLNLFELARRMFDQIEPILLPDAVDKHGKRTLRERIPNFPKSHSLTLEEAAEQLSSLI